MALVDPGPALKSLLYKRTYACRAVKELSFNLVVADLRDIAPQALARRPRPDLSSSQQLASPLAFSSEFSGGNLYAAGEIEPGHYALWIQNDFNSSRFRQWFHFEVVAHEPLTARFTLVNCKKRQSLFQQGMKIAICSSLEKGGWTHGGEQISYVARDRTSAQLNFSYTFRAK